MDFLKNSRYYHDIEYHNINYTDFIKHTIAYDKLAGDDNKYKILGHIEINKHLRFLIDDVKTYLFIISDNVNYFVSIGNTLPMFWYTITNSKEFDSLLEYYDGHSYPTSYTNTIRYYIGNFDSINLYIEEIENFFLLNNNCEKLLWGSKWVDHPFRKQYLTEYITYADNLYFSAQAMKQDNIYTMNVLTKYSKSLISIENHDGTYILSVSYIPALNHNNIPTINKVFNQSYLNDMPIDVITCIINFPAMTVNEVIHEEPFTDYNIHIIELLANTYQRLCDVESDLNSRIKTCDPELCPLLQELIDNIESSRLLNIILTDMNLAEMAIKYTIVEMQAALDQKLIELNGYKYPLLISHLDNYINELYDSNTTE